MFHLWLFSWLAWPCVALPIQSEPPKMAIKTYGCLDGQNKIKQSRADGNRYHRTSADSRDGKTAKVLKGRRQKAEGRKA
jgi:hypothetical protein